MLIINSIDIIDTIIIYYNNNIDNYNIHNCNDNNIDNYNIHNCNDNNIDNS